MAKTFATWLVLERRAKMPVKVGESAYQPPITRGPFISRGDAVKEAEAWKANGTRVWVLGPIQAEEL